MQTCQRRCSAACAVLCVTDQRSTGRARQGLCRFGDIRGIFIEKRFELNIVLGFSRETAQIRYMCI